MIKIIRTAISAAELKELAWQLYGNMIKAVIDVERGIMAVGGEFHADAEAVLMENGSKQKDLWGINIYPEKTGGEMLEFNSMINIRPAQGNKSRGVENEEIRKRIVEVVKKMLDE